MSAIFSVVNFECLAAAVKLCVVVGFHEACQTTARLCRKRCVQIFSSVTRLL